MRALAVIALAAAACGKPAPRPIDMTTVPTNAPDADLGPQPAKKVVAASPGWRIGPGNFPLPADADSGTQMMGDDITFQIPRDRDAVHAQLVAKLAADGYKLDTEQVVLGGYRMEIHSADHQYFVSVTENGDTSLMTITVKE